MTIFRCLECSAKKNNSCYYFSMPRGVKNKNPDSYLVVSKAEPHEKEWDVVVIGGGPAGMMAAGRAAEKGASVLLIEKNEILGKKLLITGGGRCNITNGEMNTRKLLANFKGSDKFLFSAFAQFSVKELLDFFHSRGLQTKEEANLRVFPKSDKARDVRDTLVEYLKQTKVTVITGVTVTGFIKGNDGIVDSVNIGSGRKIRARSYILATGGKSRPDTGSTGDGFVWLEKLGHKVIKPIPSLVPIAIKDAWVKRLQGVSVPDVKISVFQYGKKQDSKIGKILFTHFGVSGPTILNMSKEIGELLEYGDAEILLDMFPKLDPGALDKKIQAVFAANSNRMFKNSLTEILPSAVASAIVDISGISGDTFCHSVKKDQRLALVKLLKAMPMKVESLLGANKAIVTSGGVVLEEVDFKTMRSRLFSNLYLVGDILNIDRPSGGYSLQLCWTTGYVAGEVAAKII